jgi:transcriptional regulator with XRE-family HTH domain
VTIEQDFGVILRRLRKEKGLSQEGLAAESGFHRTYISLLERGLKSPSLSTIERLAKSFDVEPHYLLLLAEEAGKSDKERRRKRP